MKGISGSPVLDAYQRLAPVKGPAAPVQGPAPVAGPAAHVENAEVRISAKARGLAADGESAIDTTKVTDLKARISAGELQLDHLKIARAMVARAG